MNREALYQAVYQAIEEVNQTRPADQQLHKAPGSGLLGELDSMGLVNLIVLTEENLLDQLGLEVNLADENAATAKVNPLTSVETLVSYIEDRLRSGERG